MAAVSSAAAEEDLDEVERSDRELYDGSEGVEDDEVGEDIITRYR